MRKLLSVVSLLILFALGSAFADTFVVTANAPGSQTPTTGTFENFDSQPVGPISGTFTTQFGASDYQGVYSGALRWRGADAFGGAGGAGVYPGADSPNSYNIDITPLGSNPAANYFGLWFSALDRGSQLQFYNNSTLLFTFTPTNFINLVGACPSADPYCGNPNNGGDPGEQFAYLNFFDSNGGFNKIVVTETSACPGCGFESDNHTVRNLANGPGGTPIPTPEPASLALLASGLLIAAKNLRRKL